MTDFSGLVGISFLATQISRGSVAGNGNGTSTFTEVIGLANQSAIIGTYGPTATIKFTSVAVSGGFTNFTATVTSPTNSFANGTIVGNFLGNDATDLLLNVTSGLPGVGAAFLYVTNTVAQQPGVGNTAIVSGVGNNIVYTPPACFAEGTLIETARGLIAVESLVIADEVVIHTGDRGSARVGTRPITWIGHRRIACRRHPEPHTVWPVRIRAGAFGDNLPHRDLFLSPDHAVFVDGVLIPVKFLINGKTIAQEPRDSIRYFHIELMEHDILLADGLPCESYIDTGNRAAFENGTGPTILHPDLATQTWEEGACETLVMSGAKLVATRVRLLDQAKSLGYLLTSDSELGVLTSAGMLRPSVDGQTYRFSLPDAATGIRLVSRSAVAAHICADSDDFRKLGVAVTGVALNGVAIALDDSRLGSGWHQREHSAPDTDWRWPDGDAELLISGEGTLEITIPWAGSYWSDAATEEASTKAVNAA